ncbi:hypothetical protein HQ447_10280 [bacterium]|nr:hypothetical protein [bacterium]
MPDDIDDDPWTVSDEQKLRFAGIFLLEYMINHPRIFQLWLEDADSDLEPILEWLLVKEWIQIREAKDYIPTEEGRNVIKRFMERYARFVYFFDVFSGVDLGAGEFAFARYFEILEPDEWQAYLHDERFEDLRIAIAEHLGINVVEIVFMSFIREDRFGRDATGWQFDLLLGSVWDEILDVCNSATDVSELGYQDGGRWIDGATVAEDILQQGGKLLGELLARAQGELKGTSPTKGEGNEAQRVVAPVEFPPASDFNFANYIEPANRDRFWDDNWN